MKRGNPNPVCDLYVTYVWPAKRPDSPRPAMWTDLQEECKDVESQIDMVLCLQDVTQNLESEYVLAFCM